MSDALRTNDPPVLLRLLHALLRESRGPAGFVGTLAVGVHARGVESWWCVRGDPNPVGAFVASRPAQVDARLLLGEGAAQALARGQRDLGPDFGAEVYAEGDRALLQRFVERFVRLGGVGGIMLGQVARRR